MRSFYCFLKDNGLSIVFLGLYLAAAAGQALLGRRAFDDERLAHGLAQVSLTQFLRTGTFLDNVFVNWQAAVLQLFVLVLFGSLLYQRGATHSRKEDDDPGHCEDTDGGAKGWLYAHSLSLAFLVLFVASFALHMVYGTAANNEQRELTRQAPIAFGAFVSSAKFWSATLACWQAEFFAIFAYVVLSIFLRQKNSPESKPASASNRETGESNR